MVDRDMSVSILFDRYLGQTEMAICVRLRESQDEQWIPKSIILDETPPDSGEPGEIVIPSWFAEKEDLS